MGGGTRIVRQRSDATLEFAGATGGSYRAATVSLIDNDYFLGSVPGSLEWGVDLEAQARCGGLGHFGRGRGRGLRWTETGTGAGSGGGAVTPCGEGRVLAPRYGKKDSEGGWENRSRGQGRGAPMKPGTSSGRWRHNHHLEKKRRLRWRRGWRWEWARGRVKVGLGAAAGAGGGRRCALLF